MSFVPRADELISRKEAIKRVQEGAKFSYVAVKTGEKYGYGVDVINTDGSRSEVVMDAKAEPLVFSTFNYLQHFHFDHSGETSITVPELPGRVTPVRARRSRER